MLITRLSQFKKHDSQKMFLKHTIEKTLSTENRINRFF